MGVSLNGGTHDHFLVGKPHGFVGVSPTICRKLPDVLTARKPRHIAGA